MKPIEFNPTIAEATKIAKQYQGLTIKSVDDKEGYNLVYTGQQELKKLRVAITKYGKEQRQEALAYQKEVIRQEKELLGVITPIEDSLKAERERIDEIKKREERKEFLPVRKKMLTEVEAEVNDDELLGMDDKQFMVFFGKKQAEFTARKEEEKREKEREEQRNRELEEAKKQAVEQAKREVEERARREKKEAERRAKEELERVEREKQAEIDRLKQEKEEKERQEKMLVERKRQEEEEMAKNKRMKQWLEENGVTEENKSDHKVERQGNQLVLYKKVSTLIL